MLILTLGHCDCTQVIDARYKGNMSRLINSACEPNCVTQRWTEAATGETRVGIFTLRDVAAGEELTYDYCFTHFDADNADAASFRCCCGSPRCRGSLDTNPLRAQHRGRRVAVMWDDGTFYKGTIIHFFGSTGKYKVIYDDGDTETVKLDGEKIKYEWLPEGDAPPPGGWPLCPAPTHSLRQPTRPTPRPVCVWSKQSAARCTPFPRFVALGWARLHFHSCRFLLIESESSLLRCRVRVSACPMQSP